MCERSAHLGRDCDVGSSVAGDVSGAYRERSRTKSVQSVYAELHGDVVSAKIADMEAKHWLEVTVAAKS